MQCIQSQYGTQLERLNEVIYNKCNIFLQKKKKKKNIFIVKKLKRGKGECAATGSAQSSSGHPLQLMTAT